MEQSTLSSIIVELTERALWETENLIATAPEELWDKRYDGIPMWKFYYHMLFSMDRWYINPADEHYVPPKFHQDKLNDLNVIPDKEYISLEQIKDYFLTIQKKIRTYLNVLEDTDLLEVPEKCSYSRFQLILGQFRHWHRHMGVIYGFILDDTGKWPFVLNMESSIPEGDMPFYY